MMKINNTTVHMDFSSSEGSEASDDSGIWMSVLKCYICGDLFRKPRILPCGHTFCSDCLLSLRDEVAAEFKRKYKNACRRGESGVMVCPYPDCDYSLRIMNLRRWALKNKAAAEAVCMVRKKSHDRKDITTQTNMQFGNQPLSLPRILLTVSRTFTEQQEVNTPSFGEQMTDSIYKLVRSQHVPSHTQVKSWRSIFTLLGLNLIGEMLPLDVL